MSTQFQEVRGKIRTPDTLIDCVCSCINPRPCLEIALHPALEEGPHLKHPAPHWLADVEAVGEAHEGCRISRSVQDVDAAGEARTDGDHEIVWVDL